MPRVKSKKVFGFVHEIMSVLAPHFPNVALRLFLQAAIVCNPAGESTSRPHYEHDFALFCVFIVQASDQCGFEEITYEFVAQAFLVYEDQISDSKQQIAAISLIGMTCSGTTRVMCVFDLLCVCTVATLAHLSCFGEDNWDTLVTKATQHSFKLLRKPDKCRAVLNCAHLFWAGTDDAPVHRDAQRVLGRIRGLFVTLLCYVCFSVAHFTM